MMLRSGKFVSSFIVATILFASMVAARISQQKCREYAALVTKAETAPTLSLGVQTNMISQCGIVETPLIIGGIAAKPREFPHMVLVGFGKPGDQEVSWECGGSLISENYVLTASHCLESPDKGPAIRIRAGSITVKNPDPGHQERAVIDRIKHPQYMMPARYNDIALLKLERPVDLNAAVRPACLEADNELHGNTAIATGFGKTSFDSESGSNELLKVQLNYISKEDCEKGFKTDLGGKQFPSGIIPNMLCAGVLAGGKDTCQGDSGGPLQRVLKDPYCMYSIVGVTSFGKFCGFENSPAIYTKVSNYLDWIESVVWAK